MDDKYLEIEKLFIEKHKEFVTIATYDGYSDSVKAKKHGAIIEDMEAIARELNKIYDEVCDYYENVKKSYEYVETLKSECLSALADERKRL